jgi:hypothetical protein
VKEELDPEGIVVRDLPGEVVSAEIVVDGLHEETNTS